VADNYAEFQIFSEKWDGQIGRMVGTFNSTAGDEYQGYSDIWSEGMDNVMMGLDIAAMEGQKWGEADWDSALEDMADNWGDVEDADDVVDNLEEWEDFADQWDEIIGDNIGSFNETLAEEWDQITDDIDEANDILDDLDKAQEEFDNAWEDVFGDMDEFWEEEIDNFEDNIENWEEELNGGSVDNVSGESADDNIIEFVNNFKIDEIRKQQEWMTINPDAKLFFAIEEAELEEDSHFSELIYRTKFYQLDKVGQKNVVFWSQSIAVTAEEPPMNLIGEHTIEYQDPENPGYWELATCNMQSFFNFGYVTEFMTSDYISSTGRSFGSFVDSPWFIEFAEVEEDVEAGVVKFTCQM